MRKIHMLLMLSSLNLRDGDRNGNVMPGTVADRGITSPTEYDFWLNSHAGGWTQLWIEESPCSSFLFSVCSGALLADCKMPDHLFVQLSRIYHT